MQVRRPLYIGFDYINNCDLCGGELTKKEKSFDYRYLTCAPLELLKSPVDKEMIIKEDYIFCEECFINFVLPFSDIHKKEYSLVVEDEFDTDI